MNLYANFELNLFIFTQVIAFQKIGKQKNNNFICENHKVGS